ncbi:hypothetical protein A3A66_03505 [Microgenomates group bacterium RIFCSPLOWO2_01_FULL_46_13]|nr:MAG: hypothetical protein A3A66_03505 [Microgenomates group bacterium RIFCSPLOWO2_01_FULL_46_13]
MNSLRHSIRQELFRLSRSISIDVSTYQQFLNRLAINQRLVRSHNPSDHFCVFFVPYHRQSNAVFVGHHIKADEWLPPGGHIEPEEHPLDTLKREIVEELKYPLTHERPAFFNLTVVDIANPARSCRRHWDLWYRVELKKLIDFTYDRQEFYTASWLPLSQALSSLHSRRNYQAALASVAGKKPRKRIDLTSLKE